MPMQRTTTTAALQINLTGGAPVLAQTNVQLIDESGTIIAQQGNVTPWIAEDFTPAMLAMINTALGKIGMQLIQTPATEPAATTAQEPA